MNTDDIEYDDSEYENAQAEAAEKPKQNWRRELEAEARAAKTAKAEAEAARRELALVKAGVDPESKQGKYFAKGYDGPLDVAAIKAAAIDAGILESDEPSVPATELAQHDQLSQAAAVTGTSVDEGSQAIAEVQGAQNMSELLATLAKYGIESENVPVEGWLRPPGDSVKPV